MCMFALSRLKRRLLHHYSCVCGTGLVRFVLTWRINWCHLHHVVWVTLTTWNFPTLCKLTNALSWGERAQIESFVREEKARGVLCVHSLSNGQFALGHGDSIVQVLLNFIALVRGPYFFLLRRRFRGSSCKNNELASSSKHSQYNSWNGGKRFVSRVPPSFSSSWFMKRNGC